MYTFFRFRLIWFLWRQACRVEPSDPESVITELEAACTETHLTHQEGAVSDYYLCFGILGDKTILSIRILCYIVLYFTILCCTVLDYTILHYTIL